MKSALSLISIQAQDRSLFEDGKVNLSDAEAKFVVRHRCIS
jgi:hypothetical protein